MFKNKKIKIIKMQKKRSLILLLKNILNLFYQITLMMFRIINVNVHQIYILFDVMYYYFDEIKIHIKIFNCFDKSLIIKICEKIKFKFNKYYNKIINKKTLFMISQ